jgi:predicted amidohydrolase
MEDQMTEQTDRQIKVCVVQPSLEVGEVERNLVRVADLVRLAHREHHADVVLLPEAITSPNMYGRPMRSVARPLDGAPMRTLRGLARELGCAVGGGFMTRREGDGRGTYVLVEPDGTTHLHDKDIPSLWENAYYTGGHDEGLSTTSFGTVGLANGFEWARSRTARRTRGRAVALFGGSCWWSFPNWIGVRSWFTREHQYNMQVAREMAPRMARMIGAPVALAQHVGRYHSGSPLMPGVPYNTLGVGESQIVERDGTVLARLTYDDGEGYAAASIRLAPPQPLDPIPNGMWAAPQTASVHLVWHLYNKAGRAEYLLRKAAHAHNWQHFEDVSPAEAVR